MKSSHMRPMNIFPFPLHPLLPSATIMSLQWGQFPEGLKTGEKHNIYFKWHLVFFLQLTVIMRESKEWNEALKFLQELIPQLLIPTLMIRYVTRLLLFAFFLFETPLCVEH